MLQDGVSRQHHAIDIGVVHRQDIFDAELWESSLSAEGQACLRSLPLGLEPAAYVIRGAYVVDEDIDGAQLSSYRFNHLVYCLVIGNVCRAVDALAALCVVAQSCRNPRQLVLLDTFSGLKLR